MVSVKREKKKETNEQSVNVKSERLVSPEESEKEGKENSNHVTMAVRPAWFAIAVLLQLTGKNPIKRRVRHRKNLARARARACLWFPRYRSPRICVKNACVREREREERMHNRAREYTQQVVIIASPTN